MGSNWTYLSYPWGPSCPSYGGGARIEIKNDKSICSGDSCNTVVINASNHIGTHIDFPKHFDTNGKSALDYPANFYVHTSCVLYWLDVEQAGIVTPADLERASFSRSGADPTIVLIR